MYIPENFLVVLVQRWRINGRADTSRAFSTLAPRTLRDKSQASAPVFFVFADVMFHRFHKTTCFELCSDSKPEPGAPFSVLELRPGLHLTRWSARVHLPRRCFTQAWTVRIGILSDWRFRDAWSSCGRCQRSLFRTPGYRPCWPHWQR